MKEAEAQKAILQYLQLKKHFCWRNNTGAFKAEHGSFIRFGAKGSPDIMCIIDGNFVGLEIKGKDGRLSPDQIAFQEATHKAGGKYHILKSIDDAITLGL